MRARDGEEIAERAAQPAVVAGIGNIWKSETLFAARINPFMRVGTSTDEQLLTILRNARDAAAAERERDRARALTRCTAAADEPCRKCGTPIAYRKQGEDARGTYWCPTCQAVVAP